MSAFSPSRSTLLRTALAGTAASLAIASSASAACAPTASSTVFSKLGDTASYTLAPGGNFETGAAGWSLGGASVVSGNESLMLGSSKDARSLAIPAKSVVVSPAFCVGIQHPGFRFVARRTSGSWGVLLVKLRYTDSSGHVNDTTVGALDNSYTAWKATPSLSLASPLGLWSATQSLSVQLVLDPDDSGGNWQVDDVYIDPAKRS